MNGLAEEIAVTTLDQHKQGPSMEFTYKSGAKPLRGYTIKRGLGWGGFGEVYYALSDGGKEVALKLVRRHLDIELRGVAQCLNLKHPNLVSTFDVVENDFGENWIVMEHMAGQSLLDRLEETEGPMVLDEALNWLEGIASAIDFLHSQGIVHRDLKPGNIFSENKVVKVGDYGLSKFISASRRSGQTQSVGTVHYMAPEISTGNYGKSVDIYSAAVMAFELLTGTVPFDGETAGEVLMKHLTSEPDLSKLDPKYRPIFAKALAKDPAQRFDTGRKLVEAVKLVAQGKPMPRSETSEKEPAKPQPQASAKEPKPKPKADPVDLTQSIPPEPGTFAAKRREFSEVLWTLFKGGLLSMVLPILAMTGEQVMDNRSPDLTNYVSLALLTGLTTWGVLSLARFWEARKVEIGARRMGMFLFGLVVGLLALVFNVWVGQPVNSEAQLSAISWELSNDNFKLFAPIVLTYASLFGLSFAIPDWAKCACRGRREQFNIWRALWPGLVALIVAGVLGSGSKGLDPMGTAAVLTMSAVIVQWVAPYRKPTRQYRYA